MSAPVHQKEPTKNSDRLYEPTVGQSKTPIHISAKIAMEARKLNTTRKPVALTPRASKVMSFSDNPQTIPVRVERPTSVNAASMTAPWKYHTNKEARKLPMNIR